MDLVALALSLTISVLFALGILVYIMASRAYSYRGVRLKKFPVIGFLTVFIFQGALVFFVSYHGSSSGKIGEVPLLPCFISSLLIGALYPLTQVYQHEADRKDGVTTISMVLGKRGSFVFTMVLFLTANGAMYFLFKETINFFYLYLLILLPVVLFFLYWMQKVWQNDAAADFKHSLLMNVLSTLCTTVFFITLIILTR
jgi:1,4-dihydroxy-2-naphthoate octaprenyltransferase